MTYEQMMFAMRALSPDVSIRIRKPGDWYVSLPGVHISTGELIGSCGESGENPERAVINTWYAITILKPNEVLVTNAYDDNRKEYRWNGFMWETSTRVAPSPTKPPSGVSR